MRTEAFEHTGKTMIARDPWYGSYVVRVIGIRTVPNSQRVDVIVLQCLVPPSDRAILNPDALFHRVPYPDDSAQNFSPESIYHISASQMKPA